MSNQSPQHKWLPTAQTAYNTNQSAAAGHCYHINISDSSSRPHPTVSQTDLPWLYRDTPAPVADLEGEPLTPLTTLVGDSSDDVSNEDGEEEEGDRGELDSEAVDVSGDEVG